MKGEIARCVNALARFCGPRDVPGLTADALQHRYGIRQADVMALFGGSPMCGAEVLARAMREGIARHYVIVGGEGHTTQTLRRKVNAAHPGVETAGLPEAEIFQRYLQTVHGLQADALEIQSTNCGNNITNLLALLGERGISFRSIILCQDAAMQRRMEAGMRKYAPAQTAVINYAAYEAEVVEREGALVYAAEILGMWDVDRYVELLLGEIPRLTDDAGGYGPRGKSFIAHVDVPREVRAAFETLLKARGGAVRAANPAYASR